MPLPFSSKIYSWRGLPPSNDLKETVSVAARSNAKIILNFEFSCVALLAKSINLINYSLRGILWIFKTRRTERGCFELCF